MPTSNLRETLTIFEQIGVYDVILPMLLVFTLVFAILEKTRVFGYEQIGDKKYSRKNLNAMVAFVTSILVVGSTRLVAVINETVSNSILLLLMSFLFLLLIGSFHKETEEGIFLEKGWRTLFMIIMFIGIAIIFLNAFKLESGQSVLEWMFTGAIQNVNSELATSLILFGVIVAAIIFVTAGGRREKKE